LTAIDGSRKFEPGKIASGTRETLDEAAAHGIRHHREYDGDALRLLLQTCRSSRTSTVGSHYDRKFLERMEAPMTYASRLLAGILLIVLPSVMIGGVSILSLLIGDPAYTENPLRQDLWRAGHAHAGVWLILALVALRYVDEANLSNVMKWFVRGSIPIAAIPGSSDLPRSVSQHHRELSPRALR
jgi:hypothetical protein